MSGETTKTNPFDITKLEGNGLGSTEYYKERFTRIYEGKPTWVVIDVHAEHGRVYIFHNQRIHLATLEDGGDGLYDVYSSGPDPEHLGNFDDLPESVDFVERTFSPETTTP